MTDEPDPATSEFPAVERRGHGPGLYDDERHPAQRTRDTPWRYWPGWIVRHILPAVAMVIAAWAVWVAHEATVKANGNAAEAARLAKQNKETLAATALGRRIAIREACEQDEAIADVVRKALIGFGVGRPGNPAPPGVIRAFEPLGGLRPLSKAEQTRRCDKRVADGTKRGGP